MRKFMAVFYEAAPRGGPNEIHIEEEAPSKAAFTRRAKETARIKQWRLVEIWEILAEQKAGAP